MRKQSNHGTLREGNTRWRLSGRVAGSYRLYIIEVRDGFGMVLVHTGLSLFLLAIFSSSRSLAYKSSRCYARPVFISSAHKNTYEVSIGMFQLSCILRSERVITRYGNLSGNMQVNHFALCSSLQIVDKGFYPYRSSRILLCMGPSGDASWSQILGRLVVL